MRIIKNIKRLGQLKEQGYSVGELRWKSPREFRRVSYNQSGFELDKGSGQNVLSLSKLADFPVEAHRPLLNDVDKSCRSCAGNVSESATALLV
jgi:putative transposase